MNKILITLACIVIIFAFMYPALENWNTAKDTVNDAIDTLLPDDSSGGNEQPDNSTEPAQGAHTFDDNHVCTSCGLDARFKMSSARASDYTNYTYYVNPSADFRTIYETITAAYNNGELNSDCYYINLAGGIISFYFIKTQQADSDGLFLRWHKDEEVLEPWIYTTNGAGVPSNGVKLLTYTYNEDPALDSIEFKDDIGTGYTYQTKPDDAIVYMREIWGALFTENYNADGYADLLASTCPNT